MFRSLTRRLSALAVLALSAMPLVAQAQDLTAPQLATACTACKAASACNTPRVAGDTGKVMEWLNGARTPTALAWHTAAPLMAVEEAPAYTSYDGLVAGKRDSWVVFMRSSRDFTKARIRNWVVDVWGNATASSNAEAVLLAGAFNATNLQYALGGTARSTGTVSALDLSYAHQAPSSVADWLVGASCQ